MKTKRLRQLSIAVSFIALAVSGSITAAPLDSDDWLTDPMPGQWLDDSHFNSATMPSEDNWWRNFNDSLLDSLIEQGEANNFDLAKAMRRINIASMAVKQARSGYFPTIDLNAGWSKSRVSGAMSGSDVPATTTSGFSAGLSMSWEIDLFGKITAKAREQKSLYKASRAEYASAMVSLCSEIATAYIDLRIYQARLAVTRQHIESQKKIVKITEAREEAGISSMLDVSQAYTVYYSTVATLPALETAIHTTINAISILVGDEPGTLNAILEKPRPLPSYNMIVAAGVPMELLRRRPDIAAAEAQVEAAAASLGIARKDYLPTLTLNGSIGTEAHNAGDLFKNNSLTYTIAPTLSWTLFDGLSRSYNVATAREQMESQIENYNMTVLSAVQEVDNSMFTYLNSLKYIDDVKNVVESSSKSLQMSVDLYKRGLSQFYNVVEAQTSVLNYENNMIAARGQALQSLISLYKALGGGWNADSLDNMSQK